jgi:hypothetical protein
MATVLPPLNEVPLATECLYSTVRNISLNRMFFGFLPPHGKLLACGEELTVWGNIQDWMHKLTPQERHRRSYERALAGSANTDLQTTGGVRWTSALTKNQANNSFVTWDSNGTGGRATPRCLVLVKTPAVTLYDSTTTTTTMLWLNNGTLYTVDPCWSWEVPVTNSAIVASTCDQDSQNYLADPRWATPASLLAAVKAGHQTTTNSAEATSETATAVTGGTTISTVFPAVP